MLCGRASVDMNHHGCDDAISHEACYLEGDEEDEDEQKQQSAPEHGATAFRETPQEPGPCVRGTRIRVRASAPICHGMILRPPLLINLIRHAESDTLSQRVAASPQVAAPLQYE